MGKERTGGGKGLKGKKDIPSEGIDAAVAMQLHFATARVKCS